MSSCLFSRWQTFKLKITNRLEPTRSIGVHVPAFSGKASCEKTEKLKRRISNAHCFDATTAFGHRRHGRDCRLWCGRIRLGLRITFPGTNLGAPASCWGFFLRPDLCLLARLL